MHLNKIIEYNVMNTPWPLEDNIVDCCVTSPPYWALRNYGVDGQIGMEKTPHLYVQALVKVFAEVHRVLKPAGTLWLNLGDTYFGGKGNNGASKAYGENHEFLNKPALVHTIPGTARPNDLPIAGLKQKDLIGVPWMVAFALREAGWYLRQDIIWSKPNPMPESVTDRCTKSHEYIFLLSKSSKYYYDQAAIRVPLKDESIMRLAQDVERQTGSGRVPGKSNGNMKAVIKSGKEFKQGMAGSGGLNNCGRSGYQDSEGNLLVGSTANKKSVWAVTTKPFSEAHFATFPEELITPCVLAGCPKNGIVLDPFMGAGTTALVALSHGRNFIGMELNPEYIRIANKRLKQKFGMFYQP